MAQETMADVMRLGVEFGAVCELRRKYYHCLTVIHNARMMGDFSTARAEIPWARKWLKQFNEAADKFTEGR